MKLPRFLFAILAGLALNWVSSASAYKPGVLRELADAIETAAPVPVPATDSIEVGFSPKGGVEALVLRVTDSAKTDIKTLSYSLTSPRVVAALLCAAKRGVAVSLVADYKSNVTDNRNEKNRAAPSALAEAGYNVHVISACPIHHGEVLIVDRQTIELGSFNYSDAAARVNSENILVSWNNPALAKAYLAHFDRNWRQFEPFRARY